MGGTVVLRVRSLCQGVEIRFNATELDKTRRARDVQTAVAITVFLSEVGLRCSWGAELAAVTIKGADLQVWARTVSSPSIITAAAMPLRRAGE